MILFSRFVEIVNIYSKWYRIRTILVVDFIINFLFSVKFSQEEDDAIRGGASGFLPDISQVLSRVPREMLLVLKTNDHLRGLEVGKLLLVFNLYCSFIKLAAE